MATTSSLDNVIDALADGVTATTQSAGDNSTKIATTAYADAASALTIGSTTISSGGAGRVLYEDGSNNLNSSASFTYNESVVPVILLDIISDTNITSYYASRSRVGPAAVSLGNEVGQFGFGGYDGSAMEYSTAIQGAVDGAVSAGNVPIGLQFNTGTSSGTATTKMAITSGGLVTIGWGAVETSGPVGLLDIKAPGPLGTDEALVIRNSADTADLFKVDGAGVSTFRGTSSSTINAYQTGGTNNAIFQGYNYSETRVFLLGQNSQHSFFRMYNSAGATKFDIDGATGRIDAYQDIEWNGAGSHKMILGGALSTDDFTIRNSADTVDFFKVDGLGNVSMQNGTAPVSSVTDGFKLYSADQAAGNAAPHFRTENGSIVKLYQETALTTQLTTITYTAPSTPDYALQDITNSSPYGFVDAEELRTFISVVENLQVRVQELEDKLQNHGLLA